MDATDSAALIAVITSEILLALAKPRFRVLLNTKKLTMVEISANAAIPQKIKNTFALAFGNGSPPMGC